MIKKAIAIVLLGLTVSSAAFADGERVTYPKDYRTSLENYLSLDRTMNDDQVIRLFTSKEALAAAKAGEKIPDGTVVVAEVYKAKKDKDGKVIESALGRRMRDKFAAIAVMKKGAGWGKTIPEEFRNGDWDFAVFSPAGERLAKKDLNKCRSCHMPLADTQHLFSLEHMAQ